MMSSPGAYKVIVSDRIGLKKHTVEEGADILYESRRKEQLRKRERGKMEQERAKAEEKEKTKVIQQLIR